MAIDEALKVTGSQFVNEGVEEAGHVAEGMQPTILGIDTSTIVNFGVGIAGLALPEFTRLSSDAETVSRIVGGGSLARGVVNIVTEQFGGGGGAAAAPKRVAPPAGVSVSTKPAKPAGEPEQSIAGV